MGDPKHIQVQNKAEAVIQRFAADPIERVRILYGMELRLFQWEWWYLMDQYPDVVAKGCFRVGKTLVLAIKGLDDKLMHADEEEMIFAPKFEQAVNTFKYQYDAIYKSPVLRAYIKRTAQGKEDFGLSNVTFVNNSMAKCFGVNSNFEGFNASILHVDELDDVPSDTLKRVFGRGTAKNRNGLPTRNRLSGVIWGKLNLYRFDQDEDYYSLPPVNVYMGMAMGWLDEKQVRAERKQLTDEEWLRTMCLKYVESRNFIWSSRLHFSQMVGLKWGIHPVPPDPGSSYIRDHGEKIAFGLDMGAQGSGDDASDYSLQVTSAVGPYRRWLWGITWPGTSDPDMIIDEICKAWRFFRPDGGYGDALDANLIALINDELYSRGLVYFNWRIAGGNEQDGWKKWAKHKLLVPLTNAGRTKHHYYNSLKKAIDNCISLKEGPPTGRILVFPLADRDLSQKTASWRELQILLRELSNLESERTAAGYLKISRIKKRIDDADLDIHGESKLGDDRADGLGMSNYFLDYLDPVTRSAGVEAVYIRGV